MEYLFSYGTLQNETTQQTLFGRKLKGVNDRLIAYKLENIIVTDGDFLSTGADQNQRIAVLTNDKDDFIEGVALEIAADELKLADNYEPPGFTRTIVCLESGKKAWLYGKNVDRSEK